MNQRFIVSCLVCMSLLSLVFSSYQGSSTHPDSLLQKVLSGMVPAVVANGRARLVGHHVGTDELSVALSMPLRNQAALDGVIAQASDAQSPYYGHYLTLAQENAAFNPTVQQEQAVIAWLHAHGLKITGTFPNHLLVDAAGTFAQVERLLHVTLNDYRVVRDGQHIDFYAPASEPVIDGSVSLDINGVAGLDDLPQVQTDVAMDPISSNGVAHGQVPYYPQDLASTYNVTPLWAKGDTGSGQHIGIVLWGPPPSASALAAFQSTTQAAPINLQVIPICTTITPCVYVSTLAQAAEAAMDVEYASALAPGATIDYYEAATDQSGNAVPAALVSAVQAAGTDSVDNEQISGSWDGCEATYPLLTLIEQALESNTASGHNYFFSSGDQGSGCAADPVNNPCSFTDPSPMYPASSAFVTSVGGTTFKNTIAGNWPGEKAWTYTPAKCTKAVQRTAQGSGGGFSGQFGQPGWQVGITDPTRQRGYPDVSAEADPATGAYICYDNPQGGVACSNPGVTIVGSGTSLGAPLWAGMLAVVNQYLSSLGLLPAGFINPVLYCIATPNVKFKAFHDIAAGQNGSYQAGTGWDAVTGWGTPDLYNLARDLANPPWCISPSPNPGTTSNLLNGVAAISSTDVWAVGLYSDYQTTGGPPQTLIVHWNGVSWTQIASPNVSGANFLQGVAAVSSNDVWAVGTLGYTSDRTLIEHWDGTSWSIVSSPNPGMGFNSLYAVTAVSSTDVWAVGMTGNTSTGIYQTLIEHWDGISWSVVPSPSPGPSQNSLLGVTAISSTNVWAVGSYTDGTTTVGDVLIEHWNGKKWSIVPGANPGTDESDLRGVSAVSAKNIWAVGSFDSGVVSNSLSGETLIEHWDGASWNVVSSPNPGTSLNGLSGVAVVTGKDVWAVGYYSNVGTYNDQTLIEHWDGTSWSVVPSPNLPSTPDIASTNDDLYGVAADPNTDNYAWAVGYNGTPSTLILTI